jgi:transcription initiation factor TFIIE subunit beta
MMVKKLQESWPNAKTAIEELEKEGKVMVIRTGGNSEREGQMKMVFWDEMGPVPVVDDGTLGPHCRLTDPC